MNQPLLRKIRRGLAGAGVGGQETVGAGYFAALSEPMLAGREFVELDQRSEADGSKTLPAVLNESAARGFFRKRKTRSGSALRTTSTPMK